MAKRNRSMARGPITGWKDGNGEDIQSLRGEEANKAEDMKDARVMLISLKP
jgi:hypothetical protein